MSLVWMLFLLEEIGTIFSEFIYEEEIHIKTLTDNLAIVLLNWIIIA